MAGFILDDSRANLTASEGTNDLPMLLERLQCPSLIFLNLCSVAFDFCEHYRSESAFAFSQLGLSTRPAPSVDKTVFPNRRQVSPWTCLKKKGPVRRVESCLTFGGRSARDLRCFLRCP